MFPFCGVLLFLQSVSAVSGWLRKVGECSDVADLNYNPTTSQTGGGDTNPPDLERLNDSSFYDGARQSEDVFALGSPRNR